MIPITKAVPATIKLGGTDLEVFQLRDGSYASPGLFRLYITDIYRYGECWYWLGSPPPALEEHNYLDPKRHAFLTFQGNKLSYLHLDPVDPKREIDEDNVEHSYIPVPSDIASVIYFCDLGQILPDAEGMSELHRLFEDCHSDDKLLRRVSRQSLLRDTAIYIPPHLL
jgi:hypothetical protein